MLALTNQPLASLDMNAQTSTWLNLESAAEYSDTSVHTLRRWIKIGLLPASKLPSGTWRIKRDDLEAFLAGEKA